MDFNGDVDASPRLHRRDDHEIRLRRMYARPAARGRWRFWPAAGAAGHPFSASDARFAPPAVQELRLGTSAGRGYMLPP
jgi:hypothetical protein